MNSKVLAFLLIAFFDGYSCHEQTKYSAKYVPSNAFSNTVKSSSEGERVRIKENATNHKIGEENVQYVKKSGGENGDNEKYVTPPVSTWESQWAMVPTVATFSLRTGIPMSPRDFQEISEDPRGKGGGGFKVKKKYQKYLLPLLLAYKLKFFTLIPVMIGGLLLLVGATGLAGFFFALFAAVMGLKTGGHGGH